MGLTYNYGNTLFEQRVDRSSGQGFYCLRYNPFKSYLNVHKLDNMHLDIYEDMKPSGKSLLENALKARFQFLNTRDCLIELPNGKKVSFVHAEIFFKSESIFAQCDVGVSYNRLERAQSDFKKLKEYVQNEIINMDSNDTFGNTKSYNILKKLIKPENITEKEHMENYLKTAIKHDLELYKPASFFTSFMRTFKR